MFTRQDLPKLYHLDPVTKLKQEDKKARKLASPLISTSKLISTNDLDAKMTDTNELNDTKISESSESKSTELIEIKEEEFDLHADERISDADDKSDDRMDSELDLKEELKDDYLDKDNLQIDKQDLATTSKIRLNLSSLLEIINELKNNKSRVTKMSVEKCFQRRNSELAKNEITEFMNRCLNEDVLEKIKYRDYYGVRLKASYKNGKKSINNDEELSIDTIEDDKSISERLITDQDTNLDNLSECSSNINALNEELDDELDNSGYNTKKSSLKRCSPTIRYMLRNATEDGISPSDMLKSLQTKRILILYDLKKFIWLMKTYFVDKGICEQLPNGNYKSNMMSNDEENSNTSAIKNDITFSKMIKFDEEMDLLADEKFSDNENFESDKSKEDEKQLDDLVKQVNETSNHLTVDKINEIIDDIDRTTKNFSLDNMIQHAKMPDGLDREQLADFLTRCCENNLLKKESPMYSSVIMYSIKKSKMLDHAKIDEITLKKIIASLKILLKDISLSTDLMLIALKSKYKLIQDFNLSAFNNLLKDCLLKEGFLQELPDNTFKLLSEINDETSNASVQSASNLDTDYTDFEMISSASNDKLNLKRKVKIKDDKLIGKSLDDLTLRRPISQRKKIKKSLGPDFLDPSGMKYQLLKSSYEDKCEICLKNSDKTMVECRKCKFKAHHLCLSEIDLVFKKNSKRFECEACRIKCHFCKKEVVALINNIVTCKKCQVSYHTKCLLNNSEIAKFTKNCTACEKSYFKYLMNKDEKPIKLKDNNFDKQLNNQNSLEIDLNEASSNDINVKSNILEEVPTLTQLKEIEMTNNDFNLNQQITTPEKLTTTTTTDTINTVNTVDRVNTPVKESNQSELNSLNDESNEDSNQSNAISLISSNSNLDNSRSSKVDDETLVQKYRKLFKAYDVQQQVKISKEQFNTLKSLNSYSNGKNPIDWSVDDVADFISSVGFPEQSDIFKKEEIDGKSLLLLRRTDVLTGLSMRLGPALKVYSYIYKLQASV